jgi:uncharacterized membrane protein
MNKEKSLFSRFLYGLWSIFLKGLFTILPLTLTIALFNVSFKMIYSWLEPVRHIEPEFLQKIPYAEVVLVIVFLLALGALLNFLILLPLVHYFEDLILKIPLVKQVYSSIKQLINVYSTQDKSAIKQIALIEFPRPGMWSIGFVTSELPADLAPNSEEKFFNIFIPTTPNPTSGFLVILPAKDVKAIDLTRQEAMALIVSGGAIQPEKFSKITKMQ